MIVPPATGPEPVYSMLSSGLPTSAVDLLLTRGVRSEVCSEGRASGVENARAWIGLAVGLGLGALVVASISFKNCCEKNVAMATYLHDDGERNPACNSPADTNDRNGYGSLPDGADQECRQHSNAKQCEAGSPDITQHEGHWISADRTCAHSSVI